MSHLETTKPVSMLPIALLAAGGFVILTTEFLIVGLLPPMARDLRVTIPQAGLLVTLFAFTIAITGPILTAFLSRFSRKLLFVSVLVAFGLANVLAALSPNIWVMAVARLIPALGVSVYWSMASETAVEIIGQERAGRAISMISFGVVAATVFGIPIGTLISDAFGWRIAFGSLAVVTLAMAGLLTVFLPNIAVQAARASIRDQVRLLRDPLLVGHVLLSIALFTGMFTAYTYLADLLEKLAGFNGTVVGWTLMGFGAVGLLGNWIGGRVVDRSPLAATLAVAGMMTVALAALVASIPSLPVLMLVLAVWGSTQAALFIVSHTRLMKAASTSPAFGASLNISGANAGIGLGAILGGRVIDSVGLASIGWTAAAVMVLAMILAAVLARWKSREDDSEPLPAVECVVAE